MSPKQIISIAVVVIGLGVRLAMSMGGDDAPAPVTDPATTAAPADTAQAGATQPVAQSGAASPAPTPPTPAPKKRVKQSASFPARFAKRVDKVCSRYERGMKATIAAKGEKLPDKFRKVIRATEDMATEYEAIKPPARNEVAWNRYTDFYRDASDLYGKIETELADGDKPALDRYVAQSRKLGTREHRLNARFGFVDCLND